MILYHYGSLANWIAFYLLSFQVFFLMKTSFVVSCFRWTSKDRLAVGEQTSWMMTFIKLLEKGRHGAEHLWNGIQFLLHTINICMLLVKFIQDIFDHCSNGYLHTVLCYTSHFRKLLVNRCRSQYVVYNRSYCAKRALPAMLTHGR